MAYSKEAASSEQRFLLMNRRNSGDLICCGDLICGDLICGDLICYLIKWKLN